uniref:Uncharacterized protein LOC111114137 n=1 Tax=Crassostrea virginica TaxID=6565 RepID=A0A8B8BXM1_CRAVI|nr:uncharacterized protein LOC111114137 [Crassostrea virginica]
MSQNSMKSRQRLKAYVPPMKNAEIAYRRDKRNVLKPDKNQDQTMYLTDSDESSSDEVSKELMKRHQPEDFPCSLRGFHRYRINPLDALTSFPTKKVKTTKEYTYSFKIRNGASSSPDPSEGDHSSLKNPGAKPFLSSRRHIDKTANLTKENNNAKQITDIIASFRVSPFIAEPAVLTEIRTNYRGILQRLRNVHCLNDEKIWTSGNDEFIKLYNLKGELLKIVQTKSGNDPADIAVTLSVPNSDEIGPVVMGKNKLWKVYDINDDDYDDNIDDDRQRTNCEQKT